MPMVFVETNIAMENRPFKDIPVFSQLNQGYSIAMFD